MKDYKDDYFAAAWNAAAILSPADSTAVLAFLAKMFHAMNQTEARYPSPLKDMAAEITRAYTLRDRDE